MDKKGAITAAHCTCMAGLGEVCSHIAAIAFVLVYIRKTPVPDFENLACTDKLSKWTVPALSKKIDPSPLEDVDWSKTIKTKAYNGTFLYGCLLSCFG